MGQRRCKTLDKVVTLSPGHKQLTNYRQVWVFSLTKVHVWGFGKEDLVENACRKGENETTFKKRTDSFSCSKAAVLTFNKSIIAQSLDLENMMHFDLVIDKVNMSKTI